jgi:hypothetical protein
LTNQELMLPSVISEPSFGITMFCSTDSLQSLSFPLLYFAHSQAGADTGPVSRLPLPYPSRVARIAAMMSSV